MSHHEDVSPHIVQPGLKFRFLEEPIHDSVQVAVGRPVDNDDGCAPYLNPERPGELVEVSQRGVGQVQVGGLLRAAVTSRRKSPDVSARW